MNKYQALEYVISLLDKESKKYLQYRNKAKKQGKEMEAIFWDELLNNSLEAECRMEEIQTILSKHK